MRHVLLAVLLGLPLLATAAGWEYYTLNDAGTWEKVSRFELDLAMPRAESTADGRRMMIRYNKSRPNPEPATGQQWIRVVDPAVVESVE